MSNGTEWSAKRTCLEYLKTTKGPFCPNCLLAFVITGLSTSFKIPVAFFFVRRLTTLKLYKLTSHVIRETELEGFSVKRIVTDNASINIKIFKYFGNGEVVPFVAHPIDPTRKLFLSYNYTHLIKNMRNFVYRLCL